MKKKSKLPECENCGYFFLGEEDERFCTEKCRVEWFKKRELEDGD